MLTVISERPVNEAIVQEALTPTAAIKMARLISAAAFDFVMERCFVFGTGSRCPFRFE
jgi:hypothetical protein